MSRDHYGGIPKTRNAVIDPDGTIRPLNKNNTLPATINVANEVGSVFVFQPGGTAGGNVFTDFKKLSKAIDRAPKGPKLLAFDATYQDPIVIPSGTYNMEDVKWVRRTSFEGTLTTFSRIDISDGVVLTKFRDIGDSLFINCYASAPVCSDFEKTTQVYVGSSVIRMLGTGPFFQAGDAGGGVRVDFSGRSDIGPGSPSAPFAYASVSGTTLAPFLLQNAILRDNTFDGVPGTTIFFEINSASASLHPTQGASGATLKTNKITAPRKLVFSASTTFDLGAQLNDGLNSILKADPSGGGFTVTLPPATGGTSPGGAILPADGQSVIIKNVTNSANTITISRAGSDTIMDAAGASVTSITIATGGGFVELRSDGISEWMVLGAKQS